MLYDATAIEIHTQRQSEAEVIHQKEKKPSRVQTNALSQITFQTTSFKITGEPKTYIMRFCSSDTVLASQMFFYT